MEKNFFLQKKKDDDITDYKTNLKFTDYNYSKAILDFQNKNNNNIIAKGKRFAGILANEIVFSLEGYGNGGCASTINGFSTGIPKANYESKLKVLGLASDELPPEKVGQINRITVYNDCVVRLKNTTKTKTIPGHDYEFCFPEYEYNTSVSEKKIQQEWLCSTPYKDSFRVGLTFRPYGLNSITSCMKQLCIETINSIKENKKESINLFPLIDKETNFFENKFEDFDLTKKKIFLNSELSTAINIIFFFLARGIIKINKNFFEKEDEEEEKENEEEASKYNIDYDNFELLLKLTNMFGFFSDSIENKGINSELIEEYIKYMYSIDGGIQDELFIKSMKNKFDEKKKKENENENENENEHISKFNFSIFENNERTKTKQEDLILLYSLSTKNKKLTCLQSSNPGEKGVFYLN